MTFRSSLLNDPETGMRLALDGRQAQIWTAIPGIVQSVNLTKMTCVVQPAIQGQIELSDGTIQSVDLPQLLDVPIVFPSAGGFILTLPIAANDEVLVVFSSRCIDSWYQSGGFANRPLEMRMHDLSDGFAFPGPRSQPHVVSGISATNAQLRSVDGTVYLEITPAGRMNLVVPTGLYITGDLNVSGHVVAVGEVTGNGVALSTHTHAAGSYHVGGSPVTGTSGAPL